MPAVADIQTGRQMLPDRVCCIHVRYQTRLLPFLSIHYNSGTPQISPRATQGEASPGNNGFCFNKSYVKLCKLLKNIYILLFVSVRGIHFVQIQSFNFIVSSTTVLSRNFFFTCESETLQAWSHRVLREAYCIINTTIFKYRNPSVM